MSKQIGWKVKATKGDGEVYFIYNGTVYTDKARAENECAACNKHWPEIKYEVVEVAKGEI